jgi:Ca2+ transporting ATPase
VIVITGDNKNTAEAICKRIGLFDDIDLTDADQDTLTKMGYSFTGKEFESLSTQKQKEAVRTARLFARVEPEHKLTIVNYLREQGEVVAMTGDGVNDSPALNAADIGIAMGTGTSVAKGASKMVLQDDNFATIVKAVQEGRTIYANTKQFIRYLISSNIGEVVSIFLGAMLGIPEHLNTIQLLFCNLVTDGLPANALGFNPPSAGIMQEKPRDKDEPIVNSWQLVRYLVTGIYVGIATVVGFIWWFCWFQGGPQMTFSQLVSFHSCKGAECNIYNDPRASTVSLSILVVIEMLNALSAISENESIFVMPPWKNGYLIISVIMSLLINIAIIYIPPAAFIFNVAPLSSQEWMAVLVFSFPILLLEEILKWFGRQQRRKPVKVKKQE